MNIQEYIESGILELYVSGSLSKKEREEVEQYASQYPEIRNELSEIEIALENYAFLHAKKPSSNLYSKIAADINPSQSESEPLGKLIQMKSTSKTSSFLKYLAYAATILLFISGGLNVYYYNNYKRTKSDLASLQADKNRLASEFGTIQANYNQIASELEMMKDANNISVTMKGLAIQPDAIATVYWNKKSGDVHVNLNHLPVPPEGKQYQLWALKDGQPINAGMLSFDNTIQPMNNIAAADAFAISLEPTGGSISPTMEQIYVLGNV